MAPQDQLVSRQGDDEDVYVELLAGHGDQSVWADSDGWDAFAVGDADREARARR